MPDRSLPVSARPQLPKDYGILDKNDGGGLLPWNQVSDRLEVSRNYWVQTTRSDSRPHAKPVWGSWFQEHFYFSTSPKSITGQNLSRNSSCAVHLESGDDVVILEGEAAVVTERDFLSQLDEAYYRKYSFHLISGNDATVYRLEHRVAFAWIERDFVGSATRYSFGNRSEAES
jgi:general stress protein 26